MGWHGSTQADTVLEMCPVTYILISRQQEVVQDTGQYFENRGDLKAHLQDDTLLSERLHLLQQGYTSL